MMNLASMLYLNSQSRGKIMKHFLMLITIIYSSLSFSNEPIMPEELYAEDENICAVFGEEDFLKRKTIELKGHKILLRSVYNGKDKETGKRFSKANACVVNNLWHCHQLLYKNKSLHCINNRYGANSVVELNFNGTAVSKKQYSNAYFALTQTIQHIYYAKNLQTRVLKYGSCEVKVGINKTEYKKHYSIRLLPFPANDKRKNVLDLVMPIAKKTCYSNLKVSEQGVSCYTKKHGQMLFPWQQNCRGDQLMAKTESKEESKNKI
jgi:hypothetical protein